jgi:O-antigen/teichoic acid export membrane protein
MAYSQPMIEAGSTRTGRWLRMRRVRLALWVAVIEGLIVALTPDLSRWTVLVIGTIVLAFYVLAGRNMNWDVARQLSWIAAASQAAALLVVLFAFIVEWIAIGLVGVLAIIALVYLFTEHRRA